MPSVFKKIAKKERNQSELKEGLKDSEIDIKPSTFQKFKEKYLTYEFLSAIFDKLLQRKKGRAFYTFCLSLVTLGISLLFPSIWEKIITYILGEVSGEKVADSLQVVIFRSAVGFILVLIGIFLAYRYSKKT